VADTAAVDIPVVHTAVEGMAVLHTMAERHTAAVVGTVAVEDKHTAAGVAVEDSRLLEVEDKHAEAVENPTAVDKACELEMLQDIRRCMEVAVLKL